MHYMTFLEQKQGEIDPTIISFWVNDKQKVFFEMQPEGNNDYYSYQCMQLGKSDVEKMIVELQRLLDEYEIND